MNVLLIDDEASLRRTFRVTLESQAHRVADVASGQQALNLLSHDRFDLAFLDLRLGRESGLDVLPKLLEAAPDVGVVIVTAYAAIDTAVEAMRRGAFDYLAKPFTPDQLRAVVARWQQVHGLRQQVAALQSQLAAASPDGDLASSDPAMARVLDTAYRVAATDATVLIRGENGTGKGVLARAVHAHSPRHARPFVTVACPSLSAELLESDLFGHARGSFTGAVRDTEGKVAAAEGGTLFLDEIGDLPASLQPKLLRFLQEKAYERVGETRTHHADVRLVAATNRDLEAEVKAGRFREDLYYRLNVIELRLPPLRDRGGDVRSLALHLLQFFARQMGKRVERFHPDAEAALLRHDWPGNIRELRNAVERGVILARGPEVTLADLPERLGGGTSPAVQVGGPWTLEAVEAEHVRRVLARTPSLDDAAAALGIDPSTLYRKRKKLGL